MNPIQELERALRERFTSAEISLDPAEQPSGSWFLDTRLGEHLVNVEWRPHCGFGVTSNPDTGYGEGADEAYPDLATARERVTALLLSRGKTQPAAAATLESLRRARRVTQTELAWRLGKRQASISRIERRADIRLSTLYEVVAAMGGRLVIRAEFPDGMERQLQFGDNGSAEHSP